MSLKKLLAYALLPISLALASGISSASEKPKSPVERLAEKVRKNGKLITEGEYDGNRLIPTHVKILEKITFPSRSPSKYSARLGNKGNLHLDTQDHVYFTISAYYQEKGEGGRGQYDIAQICVFDFSSATPYTPLQTRNGGALQPENWISQFSKVDDLVSHRYQPSVKECNDLASKLLEKL